MTEPIILRTRPIHRAGVSFLLAMITFFVIAKQDLSSVLRINVSWFVFSISYLVTSWVVLCKRSISQIKKEAVKDDGSSAFVFIMILLSSFASLVMVLLLMISKEESHQWLSIPISIGGMLASWGMVHTVYGFHYAHRYYDDEEKGEAKTEYGLDFPGEDDPDYLDFIYFSFVLGCTFQVSDVDITSKKIRRIAFVHGLLSFMLNTFVIALTINFIASLLE